MATYHFYAILDSDLPWSTRSPSLCGHAVAGNGLGYYLLVNKHNQPATEKHTYDIINCLACKFLAFQIHTNVEEALSYADEPYVHLTVKRFEELLSK